MTKTMNTPARVTRRFATAARALGVAGAMALAGVAGAQDLLPAAPAQDHGIILTGGTVHTVSGETIENGVVGFNDGAITMLGDASMMQIVQLAPGTEVIDVSGHHVYPGLFAAHTQLGLTETQSVRATNDMNEIGSFNPEVRAEVAVNPDSTLIPVARLNGVLLAGVMPTGGRIAGRASVIRLDGWTWEDMSVRADSGLVINWPGVRAGGSLWGGDDRGADRRIRRSLDEIRDYFDTAAAYAAARDADAAQPRDLRLDAMRPYLGDANGAAAVSSGGDAPRVLVAADDYDQIVSAVSFGAKRGIAMAIVGGRDAPLCAELLIEHDVPVIIDGVYRFPKRADSPHDEAYTLASRLHDAGVRFCISGADRDGNVRNLPYEAAMAARFGLDRDQAVRAITLTPAEILGVADRYGSLEQGKSATLIVTTGDVLEITSNVAHAFIDGRRVSLKSKQTELRDKYVEKYRQLGIIPEGEDGAGED